MKTTLEHVYDYARAAKKWVLGDALNPFERDIFHHLSLIAFFAWVGLGADGLSSSVYGPAEAFITLKHYPYLSLFVGLASVITIFVISSAYNQIIEKFPSGGGGYLVASKLISPTWGMISGCALLVDYVLTIAISVASGTEAIFSFLPVEWFSHRIWVAGVGVIILILLNLRGVKESVMPLVPIFLIFLATHIFVILYAIFGHFHLMPGLVQGVQHNVADATSSLGLGGFFFLLLRGYSMGAGTYTGIEAVSNGVGILREPKVQTAKRTMVYMMVSLSFMVLGLMLSYILFQVTPVFGKTINAVLLEAVTVHWPSSLAKFFILVTLVSEAAILFVAAQTGFFDGPRVLSNLALDRWFPTKFAMLSDRLITQNGVLMMGVAALVTVILTDASVTFLVVLYSINVFITFVLSLFGMTRHWWTKRKILPHWRRKIAVSGTGLVVTFAILMTMVVLKFHDGGWITLLITGSLVLVMVLIKRHYIHTAHMLRKLDRIMIQEPSEYITPSPVPLGTNQGKTAVLLVNGFTGLGLTTLASIHSIFPSTFENFIFVQVGLIDAGVFKGEEEMEKLRQRIDGDIQKYVALVQKEGYKAEAITRVSIDIIDEISKLTPNILERYPNAIFFGGQLVFPQDSFITRSLHNAVVFSVQRKLYMKGIPFIILPVRV